MQSIRIARWYTHELSCGRDRATLLSSPSESTREMVTGSRACLLWCGDRGRSMRTQCRMPVQKTSRSSTSITSRFMSDGSMSKPALLLRGILPHASRAHIYLSVFYLSSVMGQSLSSSSSSSSAPDSACPVHRPQPSSGCPIQHGRSVDHSPTSLNPLNQIPSLPQTPLDDSDQLPTERTLSSIPRSVDAGRKEAWEYPSPQQFYNALVRKGWETPVEHVETMVEIHNFLNERAWGEVLQWEKRVAE